LMSGNLSYQIEHHLFPDIPACRYAELAPEVRAICEKNDLPYHHGPFWKQALSTWKRIAKLSLPSWGKGKTPAQQPAPAARTEAAYELPRAA